MSDLKRLLQEREQIEVMMEVMQLPSSQETLKERLDEVNRKIAALENEQEDNDE